MSVAGQIPEVDRKGLREFGLLFGAIIAALFGLLLPWLFDHGLPWWPWAVGGVFALWALAAPGTLRPVYVAWMTFGLVMSRITTPILMGIVFYGVVTPMAAFRRVGGRDILKRRWDGEVETYRTKSEKSPAENLKRPF